MTELFYTIVNMSISAGVLVLVVLLLRLLFRKAPKWVTVLLWGLVAVRLVCPFALETSFSLMPKTEWIAESTSNSEENTYFDSVAPAHLSTDPNIADSVNVYYEQILTPQIEINRGISLAWALSCIWLAGVAAMLVYMLVSYITVIRRIQSTKQFRGNIYTSEFVTSPFVCGLIRPRIYLPENMTETDTGYVIAHEEAHLRRLDHLWKHLGFLLLAIHWFNPLIWLGYILLCRDVEMACDQRVIRDMDSKERADYSETLLLCSTNRHILSTCPLAFGEVGVKERIKSVLNYKKPGIWIIAAALITCGIVAVCFLTNPITVRNPWVQEYVPGTGNILGQVDKGKYESVSEDFAIGADKYGRAVFKNPQKAFSTMKELCNDGLALISQTQGLAPISQRNFGTYKIYGWQMTEGSDEAQTQAAFISSFLDIYENSFTREIPNTDLPDPTLDADIIPPYALDITEAKEQADYIAGRIDSYQNQFDNLARDLVPSYVVDESYALACDTNIGKIEKNGYQVRKPEKENDNFIEIIFMAESKEIFVGVNWMREEKGAEWNLVPGTPLMIYEPGRFGSADLPRLSLNDVLDLVKSGKELTWSDFEGYEHRDVGSGLHIWELPIDDSEIFRVFVGGGHTEEKPMYITLRAETSDGETHIDILNASVEDIAFFIVAYSSPAETDNP